MNFVFISPMFPSSYWNFCDRLKKNGVNVLGIGDSSYDSLSEDLKNSLSDYYQVNSLDDYDQKVKALGYFTYKYGKIDWLESNNEYWLHTDAMLRKDFNITTGVQSDKIENYQNKALMKSFFAKANVKSANYILMHNLTDCLAFCSTYGYPVIVKPNVGVGASSTYRIENDEELKDFMNHKPDVEFIMEQFVEGDLISFDGIVDQNNQIIFCTNHVFPVQIMDVVNKHKTVPYYNNRVIPDDLKDVGTRVIKAFNVRGRFFHCEYFRLTKDIKMLGQVGDIVALEVNMRPPGGYTPDLMNFSDDIDVYQIYADMVCNKTIINHVGDKKYFVAYVGRRYEGQYLHNHEEIMAKYENEMVMQYEMPEILSAAMGNIVYTIRVKTIEEVNEFLQYTMQ